MDLRDLRYFVAAYDEGSLTAASRRCAISQPAMSTALAALEADLGEPLFLRHQKGVSPLAAAERLYPYARRLLDEAQAVRALFREEHTVRPLRVGLMKTLDSFRSVRLLQALAGLTGRPLVLVQVEADADLRIVAKRQVDPPEKFLPLWRERYVLALPASHPLTLRPRLRLADMAGLQMISRCHCEYGDLVTEGEPPRTVAVADTEDWAVALVRAGIGAAILPEGVAAEQPDIVIRRLEDLSLERVVGLGYGRRPGADSEAPELARQLAARLAAEARAA